MQQPSTNVVAALIGADLFLYASKHLLFVADFSLLILLLASSVTHFSTTN